MSTIQDFRRRFAYDEWANREVLAALRAAAPPPPVALDRMAHILSAQYVWFDRLRQQAQTFPVWPHFTRPECEAEAAKLAALWKDHLNTLAGSGPSGLGHLQKHPRGTLDQPRR